MTRWISRATWVALSFAVVLPVAHAQPAPDAGPSAPTPTPRQPPTPPPTPPPSPTQTPTPSPTPRPPPTPSPTPSPTQTPTPSPTPSPTQTPTPSPTPSPTQTPTPSPTPTPTPTPPTLPRAPEHSVAVVVVTPASVTPAIPPAQIVALTEALARALSERVTTRSTTPITDDEERARIAACADDACRLSAIQPTGADVLVLATLARGTGSTRGQLTATFTLVLASGGLPAGTPVALGRAIDARRIGTQIGPSLDPIAQAIPEPPPPPPPPPTTGTALVVVSGDGARVRIDGRPVGQSPLEPIELAPGEHRMDVEMAGWVRHRSRFTIVAGETTRVDVALARDPRVLQAEAEQRDREADESIPWWRRWYTIGGAAAAVTVITVVVVVAASSGDPEGVPVPGLR